MEITKDRKVSVISTYDNAFFYLNEEQDKKLATLGNNDKIEIEGNLIKCANIRGIYTVQKWLELHPIEHTNTEREIPKIEPIVYNKQRYLKNLKISIEAFKNVFAGREMPEPSQKVLNKLLKKYHEIELEPENKTFTSKELSFIKLK